MTAVFRSFSSAALAVIALHACASARARTDGRRSVAARGCCGSTTPATPDAAAPASEPVLDGVGCHLRASGRACLPGGVAQLGRLADESHFAERPPRGARLQPFEIDRDEVTLAAYRRCVTSGSCRAPRCDDGTAPDDGVARCVAWSDAREYCRVAGGRLPSEAEWERAAAGLLPFHRVYPWGDATDAGSTVPADETPEGVRGLGGGVAEWVDDGGAFYLLPPRPDAGLADAQPDGPPDASVDGAAIGDAAARPETAERELGGSAREPTIDAGLPVLDDPRGPASAPWRVVRGGHAGLPRLEWTTTVRRFRLPSDRKPWIGFRCVYDLAIAPGNTAR